MKKVLTKLFLVSLVFLFLPACKNVHIIDHEKALSDVTLESVTVLYDGNQHSIYVSNTVAGYNFDYIGNEVTEVGLHEIVCNIYYGSDLVKSLSANIEIIANIVNNLDLSKLKFSDCTFDYDGIAHSILLEGLSESYIVTYTGNEQTEIGVYFVKAKILNSSGEEVVTLTAVLSIRDPLSSHYESMYE